MTTTKYPKGGEFLVKETKPQDIFIPEEFSEEQIMIKETCRDFLEKEVAPLLDEIDNKKDGLMVELLGKAGELGLLGIAIPEKYEGFGQDMNTSMLSTEIIGTYSSFAVAFAAHAGISTLPILYYGTEEQKNKYLPKLASGEYKGAYCLTEPGAGSDASSCKSKVTFCKESKHYILNGQKMWITNAGFADVFTVFAKIDDDKELSAFIVEKSYDGISLGQEEPKMGIKGSSTCMIFFEDCKIPSENLLGQRGDGFRIALNVLNNGRLKLAAAVLGAGKNVITNTITYANERVQFGKSISNFGAIKAKMGQQCIRLFAIESAIYRCSNDIHNNLTELIDNGMSKEDAVIKAQKEFAAESAILKVASSEALDFVVDEGVQIYGGMGYSSEAPMERAYRDSRINRIFEGTNEINRMLVVDFLLKKAFKNELPLLSASQAVAKELMSIPDFGEVDDSLFIRENKLIANFKKAALLVAGAAAQKFMKKLGEEQEVLMNISDIIADCYLSESVLLRVERLIELKGEENCKEQIAMAEVFLYDAADRIHKNAKDALNSFASGDELRMMLLGIKRFTKHSGLNSKESRRIIAKKLIEENRYCF
ncbi:alkylation response protein AidB-like acyl-CoA dehydrogenase [Ancylomarina subtilis]|uniref:Alkylation response protein AidB-like acyl-CoA dehydrogenase n=1 Tax=Ancylomarina subtilis TaxID=1639035 RepID=A0A4Q7VBT3_9BACT|nr:acyl-CoA dehydrogenase family protein [Ancylomarina subtilis]RZT93287.1 alkylation response protein AidB-like acyl-CoA dehydrogenase [Ancylomarina subtilis]